LTVITTSDRIQFRDYIALKQKAVFLTLSLIAFLLASCHNSNSTGAPEVTSHSVDGSYASACLICHGEGSGIYQFPVIGENDHRGWSNSSCPTCHK
jgi:hypothetical protein